MRRLSRTLRPVAVTVTLLVFAAGASLSQDAAESDDAEAQFVRGFMLFGAVGSESDEVQAWAWIGRSAEGGFARAQAMLGELLIHGRTAEGDKIIVEQDTVAGARWCRRAAEQGDGDGQFCLALLYANGTGVEQDDAESARWLRMAAGRGKGEAQARLGDLYAAGARGVPRDPEQADRWYRRAADPRDIRVEVAGHGFYSGRRYMSHLRTLGEMYRVGMGVPRDEVAAYKWLDIADRLSEPLPAAPNAVRPATLRERIDRLAERMTAAEVAEAKRAADAFVETYRQL